MKLEQQVVNLELSQKLKELGVKQESLFYWNYNDAVPKQGWYLDDENLAYPKEHTCHAYTGAELGEMLPQILKIKKIKYQLFVSVAVDKQWFVVYANEKDYSDNAPIKFMMCHNEANARAKMLIYLLENKFI